MNSTYAPGVMLSPQLVAELVAHLNSPGSTLGVPEAAARAIRAWISGAPPAAPAPPPADAEPTRGFQWKNLFLPSGTELRMAFGSALREAVNRDPDRFDRIAILRETEAPVMQACRAILRNLGAAGRAQG